MTAYIPTFCVDYIEIPGSSIQDADLRFTYRIPEQENIWNAYRIISRRLLTIVDVPFKMDAEGRNVGDTSQYVILREALANCILCKCLHKQAYVKSFVMSTSATNRENVA